MIAALDNYISRGTDVLLGTQEPNLLEMLMTIPRKLMLSDGYEVNI